MKLFVIGNGFDLAHGIKSKYWNFGEYLADNYPSFFNSLNSAINNDQGIWSDFEAKLPDCGRAMEDTGLSVAQQRLDELDYDPMSDEGMGIWMNDQLRFINSLPNVLRSWIESIDIHKPKAYIEGLMSNDDYFLSFNYTNTLEEVYGIEKDNILHIHGDVNNTNHELIMGHGDMSQIMWVEKQLHSSEEAFADCAISIYKSELDFLSKTYKNTHEIISRHEDFFDEIVGIDEIYVIGSSLSEVDKTYFEKIHESTLAKWIFVFYDTKDSFQNRNAVEQIEKFAKRINLMDEQYIIIPDTDILNK